MRILLVTATDLELEPFLSTLRHISEPADRLRRFASGRYEVDVLATGVGMVATAAWCSRALQAGSYGLALNLGICGSFDPAIGPGTVVHVVSDMLAELGAEDGDAFLTLEQLGLLDPDEFPFQSGRLVNGAPPANPIVAALPRVSGITVSTVHGNERTIARIVERLHPQVESMEGAAFMYACLIHGVPFAQVRAVSNVVERRNRAAWKMTDAVAALAGTARRILDES